MILRRINDVLHFDSITVDTLAHIAGTPCYVYSWTKIEQHLKRIEEQLAEIDHQIKFAVKANSNINILGRLADLGIGFDVVSGGELELVLQAGVRSTSIQYSGLGKSTAELAFALKTDIGCINVESLEEIARLKDLAKRLNTTAQIALRINPLVQIDSHEYLVTAGPTSKFGILPADLSAALDALNSAPNLQLVGLSCHLGSEISTTTPYEQALQTLVKAADTIEATRRKLAHLNLGGGFANHEFPFAELAGLIQRRVPHKRWKMIIEPGRSLIAAAGVLITKVEYLKESTTNTTPNFAIVDAGMNDFLRPALYSAQHPLHSSAPQATEIKTWDVVGPVCESADTFARNVELPIDNSSYLVIENVGAYGFVLSSNYNSRPKPAEILIDDGIPKLIRERESFADLVQHSPIRSA